MTRQVITQNGKATAVLDGRRDLEEILLERLAREPDEI